MHELIGGRYLLQEKIGHDTISTLYRGTDLHTNRPVAVKVLRDVYCDNQKYVRLFQRETNRVQVYDCGWSNGRPYSILELVEGADMSHYLQYRDGSPNSQLMRDLAAISERNKTEQA